MISNRYGIAAGIRVRYDRMELKDTFAESSGLDWLTSRAASEPFDFEHGTVIPHGSGFHLVRSLKW